MVMNVNKLMNGIANAISNVNTFQLMVNVEEMGLEIHVVKDVDLVQIVFL